MNITDLPLLIPNGALTLPDDTPLPTHVSTFTPILLCTCFYGENLCLAPVRRRLASESNSHFLESSR
jgi:hypothetical protein